MWLLILEKAVYEKLDRVRGSGYLSGRYGKDRSTPLSPSSWVSTNKMKQSWHLIKKTMNTRINHAHMGIWICIENNQSGSGCVPDKQTATRYHKRGLVRSNEHKACHSYHQIGRNTNSTHVDISFKFIFILKKIYLMSGPHQSPFIFTWINSINSIIRTYGI